MKRSVLWVCALLLVASQAITAGWAAAQAPSSRSAPAPPDPHAGAQASRRHAVLAAARIRHALRDEVNSGLVSIISGGMGDADLDETADLAASLDRAPGHLQVLPVVSQGAFQDVNDVVFARGIDVGIIQSDVLAAVKRHPPFPGVERYLQYITKLYDKEMHVLAGKDIRSINELAHKKVNFGLRDSGTDFTAGVVFRALGIPVEATNYPEPVALEKLRMGEISAMVDVVGKPSRLFQDVRPDEGLHFLSVPAAKHLTGPNAACRGVIAGCAEAAGTNGAPANRNAAVNPYLPASLTAADYPELIEMDKPVGTIAVGTVLVTYNWPRGTQGYRNVAQFVRGFFEQLRVLRAPPHQPEWRDVDLAAAVPGWTRFAPAEQWVQKAQLDDAGPHRLPHRVAAGTAGSSDPRRIDVLPAAYRPQPSAAAGGAGSLDLGRLFADFAAYQKRQGAAAGTARSLDPRRIDALLALFAAFAQYQRQQASAGSPGDMGRAREARRRDRKEGWPG
jgi:TRAP-type uncharacterized transport system substrate-binding protein